MIRKYSVQGPVTKANRERSIYGVKQLAGFNGRKDRGLSFFNDMFGTLDRVRRVDRQDLADHQPVEKHPGRSELQLDRGCCDFLLQLLDVDRDMKGEYLVKLVYAAPGAPGGERPGPTFTRDFRFCRVSFEKRAFISIEENTSKCSNDLR